MLINALQDWQRYFSKLFSLKLAWFSSSEVGLKLSARGIDSLSRSYDVFGHSLAVFYTSLAYGCLFICFDLFIYS
jgi:hypothetical protein